MGMSRSSRIILLLVIDILFFFVELIVGYAVGSLALVADSFHMLNDVMSLIVALYAIKLTERVSVDSRYSYGWHRAEILAALINGVFLLALCFSIALEAIGRFFTAPEISNAKLIVVVGSLGLVSNLVGLVLFHEHGHSHSHSHSHSHTPTPTRPASPVTTAAHTHARARSHSHTHSRSLSPGSFYGHPAATRASVVQTAHDMASSQSATAGHTTRRFSLDEDRDIESVPEVDTFTPDERTALLADIPHGDHGHTHSHGSMNMRGLFLHVVGDMLGNVGVIATGLVIWLTEWKFKYYFDPVISLVITVIIFSSALPLVKSTSFILLQGVPTSISLEQVRAAILQVETIISVHELHIWQLSESKIVASVHVLTSRNHDFLPIASQIRKVLHEHGIHSSTIQPEYVADSETPEDISCLIVCPPDKRCDPQADACCPPITTNV